jgi:hypothetical protein
MFCSEYCHAADTIRDAAIAQLRSESIVHGPRPLSVTRTGLRSAFLFGSRIDRAVRVADSYGCNAASLELNSAARRTRVLDSVRAVRPGRPADVSR